MCIIIAVVLIHCLNVINYKYNKIIDVVIQYSVSENPSAQLYIIESKENKENKMFP